MLPRGMLFAAATACLVMPVLAAPSAGPSRLVEPAGGFSYVPPVGWRVGTFPGLKYKIAYSQPVGGFAPNINVIDEPFAGSLADYAKINLEHLKQRYPGFHALGQSAFVTTTGLHGIKLISEATPMGKKIRQTFFLFPGHGSQKLVVTASSLASEGSKYDRVVEAAMKTFVVK